MPKFHVYSNDEMVEYLNQMMNDSETYPGYHCGLGIGWKAAKEQAKEEKATLPEEEWSIPTLLTDWGAMFNEKFRQLKNNATYSNEGKVIASSDDRLTGIIYMFKSVADRIFQNKPDIGAHNGIMDIYNTIAGVKEEKWAEMPEFAHYAKLLMRKCNLPLPARRKDPPTRQEAEENYIKAIEGDEPSEKNLQAMLGILAVRAPFKTDVDALIEDENDQVMYTEYAHPILTAASEYELSQNKAVMELLNTGEAVKAAKEGTLSQLVNERVFDPEAAAKAKAAQEEAERQRMEREKQRAAEEKVERGRAVQKKRREDLREMLTRLGVTDADIAKNPEDLKLSGSTEYNNMARAALEAYQSASGEEAYNIDLDDKVRNACFAYTKGKKSVRFFESGRKRFDTCLELMMSVSGPNEKGEFREDIQKEFARINEVRKAKEGDPNYVSPRYFKFQKNQITVQQALDGLPTHSYATDENNKPNKLRYDTVLKALEKSWPRLSNGEIDRRALVDDFYMVDVFNPVENPLLNSPIAKARNEYKKIEKVQQEERDKERSAERQRQAEEQEREKQRRLEEEKQRKLAEEQRKLAEAERKERERLEKQEAIRREEAKEFARLRPRMMEESLANHETAAQELANQTDKENAEKIAKDTKEAFTKLLYDVLPKKQAAADDEETAKYQRQELVDLRGKLFDAKQMELSDAWEKDYLNLNYVKQVSYNRRANKALPEGQRCAADLYYNMLDQCWIKMGSYRQSKRRAEELDRIGNQGFGRENAYMNAPVSDAQAYREAGRCACAAFACTKLFKPDEAVDMAELKKLADKMDQIESLRTSLQNSVTMSTKNQSRGFDMDSKTFANAQIKFNNTIRYDHVTGRLEKKQGLPQTLTVADVQKELVEAGTAAKQRWDTEKKKFDDAEQARFTECKAKQKAYLDYLAKPEEEKKNAPEPEPVYFAKGAMPEGMHEARTTMIRSAVASRLLEKMYPDPNAAPDLKKLSDETETVIRNGKLMVDTLNQELSNHLLQTVRNLCDQHLQKAAEKDQPNVSAGGNDKKKKKSNDKPKMGGG